MLIKLQKGITVYIFAQGTLSISGTNNSLLTLCRWLLFSNFLFYFFTVYQLAKWRTASCGSISNTGCICDYY